MLKAIKDAPDAPSPFVWVYPFREYNESTTAQQLNDMFSEDWFVRNIISSGFPLCFQLFHIHAGRILTYTDLLQHCCILVEL